MQHRGFTPALTGQPATALTSPALSTADNRVAGLWLLPVQGGAIVGQHQVEFEQLYPQPGWCEHGTAHLGCACCACCEPGPAAAAGPGPWRRCLGPGVAGRAPAALRDQPTDTDVPSLVACQIQ